MIQFLSVATPEVGDRSYLIHDGTVGAVIDPQRDVDRLLALATKVGVRIACVAETHIHNDYVSGGAALAGRLGVPYLVSAAEQVDLVHRPVGDGYRIQLSPSLSLAVLSTPGHTPHHVSYVVLDAGGPVAVCTGGSLLFGTMGRTDLTGSDRAAELARYQYQSARRLGRLGGGVAVLPTHGFGSYCSAGVANVDSSTISEQRAVNLAFLAADEASFVDTLLGGLSAYPAYYAHMAAINRGGAPPPDLSSPPRLNGRRLVAAVESGTWVVDLRERSEFAAGHLRGSIGIEYGMSFATYLGWIIPWEAPVALIAERRDTLAFAQRDLSRIGIERLAGCHVGRLRDLIDGPAVRSYPTRCFAEVPRRGDVTVLDVRRDDEWMAGHLNGALHIPLPEVLGRMDEVPDTTIWVHCAAGYRAGIAASLLDRAGHHVVLVNDEFARSRAA